MDKTESVGLWLRIVAALLPIVAYQIYQSDRIAKLEAGWMETERHISLVGHPSMMQLMGGQQARMTSIEHRLAIMDGKLDRIIREGSHD